MDWDFLVQTAIVSILASLGLGVTCWILKSWFLTPLPESLIKLAISLALIAIPCTAVYVVVVRSLTRNWMATEARTGVIGR